MKREIQLSDSCHAPQLWGYAGEKDHSVLIVELSKDIADCDFCQAEITIKGNLYRIDDLEIIDSKVRFELTAAMVEESGTITAQIVGYVVDENGNILEIAKSEIYKGNIKKSSSGKLSSGNSDPTLLERILAKLHVLIEKAHTHLNKSILDRFGEDEHGGLLYAGKEISSGGVQSLVAFPEVAKEGDVVLLHRCNEISADDSNSGVVLDTAAIASLKLPEGITDRYWEFDAPNPTGHGFNLVLEQKIIEEEEPYILTGIVLFTEKVGGRWYWRDGKPYYDIPNATDEPLPDYITLGVVESFTATKDPLYGDNILDIEDTDNTTIFRTAPREYMYTGGEWKLTERTDEAEGSIISEVKTVVKDGQNFLELRLADSRNFKTGKKKDFIYIPVAGVKDVTQQSGGITLNGAEVILQKPEEKYVSMTRRETNATETTMLQPNVFYNFEISDTLTLDFAEGAPNKVNEYLFSFISGETATVLTLPSSVKWVNELTVEANKRYEISVVDNVALWCAVDEVTE